MELEKRIEELEKKVAELEGQVQVQPENQSMQDITKAQLSLLQLAQKQCLGEGLYDYIGPIARIIIDITTQV